MSGLGRRFWLRCSAEQLERWTRLAGAAELSLSVWARNALDDSAAVQEIILRDEARLQQQGRHLHSLDPFIGRQLVDGSVPPEDWPDPPSHKGGEQA